MDEIGIEIQRNVCIHFLYVVIALMKCDRVVGTHLWQRRK
jgi:hypothetical protein